MRKHQHAVEAEKKELQQTTPISKLSKVKLVNVVKTSRISKCKALLELNKIRAQFEEDHVSVSEGDIGICQTSRMLHRKIPSFTTCSGKSRSSPLKGRRRR